VATMLITCTGCQSKIRVPDKAAGKRVKCPKCATVIQVPDLDKPADLVEPEPDDVGVSSRPMPPPPPVETEPEEEEASTKVTSRGAKPPPIKPKRASSIDDGDDDEDEPKPPSKRRRHDEDDDDELDVRRPKKRRKAVNGMALTSMIVGIVAVSFGTVGICCCGMIGGGIAVACGGTALVFGFMGRGGSSDGYALTGIICGAVGLVCGLIGILLGIFALSLNLGGMNFNQNFNPQQGRRRF
jgi:predicted Zn finger-like uncharacterized protein